MAKILSYILPHTNAIYKTVLNKNYVDGRFIEKRILICSNPNNPGEFQVRLICEDTRTEKQLPTKIYTIQDNGDETGYVWRSASFPEEYPTLFKTTQIKSKWNGRFVGHLAAHKEPDYLCFFLEHIKEGEEIEIFD